MLVSSNIEGYRLKTDILCVQQVTQYRQLWTVPVWQTYRHREQVVRQRHVSGLFGASGVVGHHEVSASHHGVNPRLSCRRHGPVPLSCCARCSFKPPFVRMRPGFFMPVLSGDDADPVIADATGLFLVGLISGEVSF